MQRAISLLHVSPGGKNKCYRTLKIDLANDMTKGTDNFPKTMVETMQMLNDYKVSARQVQRKFPKYHPAVSANIILPSG
jgi:hypothetical protein